MRALKQFQLLDQGYTLDEVLNPEQDKAQLAEQYRIYKIRQANPPRKCRRSSTQRASRSRRKVEASASLRGSYHQQEDARLKAEAEKVSRVNEKRTIPWNVGGEMRMLEVT
jgi:hypothetical protein